MKKILAFLLAILIICFNVFALASCKPEEDPTGPSEELPEPEPESPPSADPEQPAAPESLIVVPAYKDYGRGTENFSDFSAKYKRPDAAAISAKFDAVSALIRANEVSFEDQLEAILSLEPDYEEFNTMYSLANIFSSKNTKDEIWAAEYDYLSSASPAFSKAIEDLYVACAQSAHKEQFESEYFKEDISKYADGGRYTNAAVAYMEEEAALENAYRTLSPATVTIEYSYLGYSITDTYESVLSALKIKYAANQSYYQTAAAYAGSLYRNAYNLAQENIYIELVKLRSLLATELGYSSYLELAYDDREYGYTPEEMLNFIDAIAEYVMPMLSRIYPDSDITLSSYKLYQTINAGYSVSGALDGELGEIYAYMLQHGLYDVSTSTTTRLDASFTTYLYTNSSPFMYITASESESDLLTLMHEFGHFADGYVNNSLSSPLETSELCSQGMEYLALVKLKNVLGKDAYNALTYTAVINALDTLWYQGLLADFEHRVYSLAYNEITSEALALIAAEVGADMNLGSYILSTSDLLVLHSFVAPMYVQSYCTSILPALELYLMELEDGSGTDVYMDILHRESDVFTDVIDSLGLSSPFDKKNVSDIMNGLAGVIQRILEESESAAA